jgi:hypothetical protein
MKPIVIYDSSDQEKDKIDIVINKILHDIFLQISYQYEESVNMTDLAIFGATNQEKLNVPVQEVVD